MHRHLQRVAAALLVVQSGAGSELPGGRVDREGRRIRASQRVGQAVVLEIHGRHRRTECPASRGVLGHLPADCSQREARVVVGRRRVHHSARLGPGALARPLAVAIGRCDPQTLPQIARHRRVPRAARSADHRPRAPVRRALPPPRQPRHAPVGIAQLGGQFSADRSLRRRHHNRACLVDVDNRHRYVLPGRIAPLSGAHGHVVDVVGATVAGVLEIRRHNEAQNAPNEGEQTPVRAVQLPPAHRLPLGVHRAERGHLPRTALVEHHRVLTRNLRQLVHVAEGHLHSQRCGRAGGGLDCDLEDIVAVIVGPSLEIGVLREQQYDIAGAVQESPEI